MVHNSTYLQVAGLFAISYLCQRPINILCIRQGVIYNFSSDFAQCELGFCNWFFWFKIRLFCSNFYTFVKSIELLSKSYKAATNFKLYRISCTQLEEYRNKLFDVESTKRERDHF